VVVVRWLLWGYVEVWGLRVGLSMVMVAMA